MNIRNKVYQLYNNKTNNFLVGKANYIDNDGQMDDGIVIRPGVKRLFDASINCEFKNLLVKFHAGT